MDEWKNGPARQTYLFCSDFVALFNFIRSIGPGHDHSRPLIRLEVVVGAMFVAATQKCSQLISRKQDEGNACLGEQPTSCASHRQFYKIPI